jgi:guanylate cyclase
VITSFVLDVMGLALSAYVMLGYFVEQRERAHRALEAERERSERLLLNVLPGYRVRDRSATQSPIAERLKVGTGGDRGSLRHGERAVRGPCRLQRAVVGHGRRRARGPPGRDFLGVRPARDAEGVEKIKTIGDAYMVAGELPLPRRDHLEAVAQMALAMRDEVEAIGKCFAKPL